MSILGLVLPLLGGGTAIGAAVWLLGPQKVLAFVMENWKALALGAAVLLAVLYVRHLQNDAKDARADSARWQDLFHQEKAAFATEKTSLDGARAHIADDNRRILAQAADLDQAKRDNAANVDRNAKLAQSTDVRIAAVRASATNHQPCVLPDAAKKALDGL